MVVESDGEEGVTHPDDALAGDPEVWFSKFSKKEKTKDSGDGV